MIRVLVAEDDKFLIKAYSSKLKKEGFEAILAVDGEEAISQAMAKSPEIILLDLVMPKKDGFEVLSELKQSDKTRNIPVVVLSNLGQEEDIDRCKALGADDYLVKSSISINDVVEKIREILAKTKK